jgi:hypothetical protein
MREKIGDIFLTHEKERCAAYFRPTDGSSDVFLCAMDLSACSRHPHLRKMLIELASEVALNRMRAAGDSVTFRVREPVVEPRSRWADFGALRDAALGAALRNCPRCGRGA